MALTRKHVMYVQNETKYGEDALASVSEDARKMFAIEAEDQSLDVEYDLTERTASGATLSQRRNDLVGVGTAPASMRVDFRGMGTPSTDPEWFRPLKSCGFQVEDGFKMAYSSIAVTDEFVPGTQITGPNTTADASGSWTADDAGAGTADNQPAVDDVVIAYNATGGNPDKPRVTGRIVSISGTDILIRHDSGSAGSILSGDTLRATTASAIASNISSITTGATTTVTLATAMDRDTSSTFTVTISGSQTSSGPNINGTHTATVTGANTFTIPVDTSSSTFTVDGQASAPPEYAYTTVSEDQPTGIVCHATSSTIYGWLRQGVFQEGDSIVAQRLFTTATCDSFVTHGRVARPVSQPEIQFTVGSWSGSDPSAGTELLVVAAGGIDTKATCKVLSYDSGTGTVTATLPSFGSIDNTDVVVDAGSGSSATASSDQTITKMPSATIYSNKDGQRKIGTGSYGNVQVELSAGSPGSVTMPFQCKAFNAGSTIVHPANIGIDLTLPPRWQGGVAKFNGVPLRTLRSSFDMGNDIQPQQDANAAEGFVGYMITSRSPSLSFSVMRAEIAALHFETQQRTAGWIAVGYTVGDTEGNLMTLTMPRTQITGAPDGDENGNITKEVTAKCLGIVGDDEVLIGSF